MKKTLQIHQATAKDHQVIKEILTQTAEWLKSIGSTQWSEVLQGKDNHNTPKAIERGEVYYATLDGKVAGMFILWNQQSNWDKEMWGADNQEWMYLHRVNIMREFAGTSVAHDIVEEAKNIALEKQVKGIRLDCMAEKEYLNTFYKAAGFTFVKEIKNYDTGVERADFNLYHYLLP